jgi:hypothetical protein
MIITYSVTFAMADRPLLRECYQIGNVHAGNPRDVVLAVPRSTTWAVLERAAWSA